MNLLYSNCVPKELTNTDTHKCNVALNDLRESTRQLRQELGFPNLFEIFTSRKKSFALKNRTSSNLLIRELARSL